MSGFDQPNYGKPKKNMIDDDDDEEVTRKVAAVTGAGISFAPINSSSRHHHQFNTPSFSNTSNDFDFASYQSTATTTTTTTKQDGFGTTTTTRRTTTPIPARTQKETVVVEPYRWELTDVPTLPEFHPLERTACFVVEYSSPIEVSSRISAVLRERSIDASYDNEKARVRCRSSSGVDFRIRLYRGRGNYKDGIIVEVQRRFGYAIDFHSDTKAILEAAEGITTTTSTTPPPPPGALSSSCIDMSNTNSHHIPMVSDVDDDYDDSCTNGASSLAMISKMLSHSGHDSHHLALQTLMSLTDGQKMGTKTARNVSIELLKPDNDVGMKIIDYIVSKRRQQQHDNEEEIVMFNLHGMAITILANALCAVKGKISSMLRELIRPYLLQQLEEVVANASTTTNNNNNKNTNLMIAQQAARCFEYLYKEDHDIGQIKMTLEKAIIIGQARHAGLEKQIQQTLDKMGQ